jgi:hypothetical protein
MRWNCRLKEYRIEICVVWPDPMMELGLKWMLGLLHKMHLRNGSCLQAFSHLQPTLHYLPVSESVSTRCLALYFSWNGERIRDEVQKRAFLPGKDSRTKSVSLISSCHPAAI